MPQHKLPISKLNKEELELARTLNMIQHPMDADQEPYVIVPGPNNKRNKLKRRRKKYR